MNLKTLLIPILLFTLSTVAYAAEADLDPALGFTDRDLSATGSFDPVDIIKNITNIIVGVLVAVGVIFGVLSGYTYLTAAGDPKKVAEASKKLIYAAVGIGAGLLAKVIITALLPILGVNVTDLTP